MVGTSLGGTLIGKFTLLYLKDGSFYKGNIEMNQLNDRFLVGKVVNSAEYHNVMLKSSISHVSTKLSHGQKILISIDELKTML